MLIEKGIPYHYIFNLVKHDVFRVLLVSALFHILKLYFNEYLPPIPLSLPAVLGTSISLILAFKLSQSYDRWWEARKAWGAIITDSRLFVLELKTFVDTTKLAPGDAKTIIQKMAHRQICWCYSLGESLRNLDPSATINHYLSAEETAFILSQTNKAYAMLGLHMDDLKNLTEQEAINLYQQLHLANTVVRLTESMGRTERIKNTIFPVTYRLFVHFFIYLFLIILSLGLVETIGIFEIPILTAIATTFFLLEKTATNLQNPFQNMPTDTPVTAIARTIEINIKQLLKESEIPEPLVPEAFYLK